MGHSNQERSESTFTAGISPGPTSDRRGGSRTKMGHIYSLPVHHLHRFATLVPCSCSPPRSRRFFESLLHFAGERASPRSGDLALAELLFACGADLSERQFRARARVVVWSLSSWFWLLRMERLIDLYSLRTCLFLVCLVHAGRIWGVGIIQSNIYMKG